MMGWGWGWGGDGVGSYRSLALAHGLDATLGLSCLATEACKFLEGFGHFVEVNLKC